MTKNEANAIAYDERYNSTRTLLWNLSESAPPAGQDAYWDLYMQFDSAHTLDAADLDEIQMIDTRNRRAVYDGVAEALDWMLAVAAKRRGTRRRPPRHRDRDQRGNTAIDPKAA